MVPIMMNSKISTQSCSTLILYCIIIIVINNIVIVITVTPGDC